MLKTCLSATILLLVPVTAARGSGEASSPSLPFAFVENHGQAPEDVRIIGNGPGFRALFRENGFTLHQGGAVAKVSFAGGAAHPVVEVGDSSGATASYLRGSDRGRWLSGLPLYRTVRYHGVWPRIEVRFRAEGGKAKAEYEVAPGADIGLIRLRFDGDASIGKDGSLSVKSDSGTFREDPPYLYQEGPGYQEGAGMREEVAGRFRINDDGTVGFAAEEWDHSRPLVIDPTILFSGYFGGSAQTNITGMAVNSWYNTVVVGWTLSTELNAQGGARATNSGGVDAFVATFGPAGGNLVSFTYLGGSGDDRAFGVAVDSSNNIYVTGWTSSKNFPVVNPVQAKLSGTRDAFILKLNAAASTLVYSTYLGGTGVDTGNAIKLDSSNAPLIVGDTTSTNLPATAGAFQRTLAGGQDAFVAKLNAAGTSIALLTYFGGTANEHGAAITTEPTGTFAIGGSTYSSNLPVLNAMQPKPGGGQDAFITRFSATASTLVFSTYLGGAGGSAGAPEQANGLAFNQQLTGRLVLMAAGVTASANFPVTAPVAQPIFGGGQTDGWVAYLTGDGLLKRASFLGGSGDDGVLALVLDPFGSWPIVGGYTTSADFPVANPVQNTNRGGMDGFIVRHTLGNTTHGTYLGGAGSDCVNAVAVDSMYNFYGAGSTGSPDMAVKASGYGYQGAALGGFVTKISAAFSVAVANPPLFIVDKWRNTGYNGPASTLLLAAFGQTGDIPVTGDWDGTGTRRIGVFRNGVWILDSNGNYQQDASDRTVIFGQAGDLPVVGDWTGSGKPSLGLYRQGTFILDLSGHLSGVPTGYEDATFAFGLPGDLPFAGDWGGTGVSKVGVFRNGLWLLDLSGTHTPTATYNMGQAGDRPVVGNWGGNGDRVGIYRNGAWLLDYDRSYTLTDVDMYLTFGGSSYVPLVW